MKKIFLLVIALIAYNVSYSQQNKKLKNQEPVIPKNTGLSENIFHLSAQGAISDAEIGMNSIVFGTDNTAAIQAVLDNAKKFPVTVFWDGKYSVTGLIIYSNTTIIANAGCGVIHRVI
jgi:hypothetical protein